MAKKPAGCISVLAGTNGAGKSSVGGAMIRAKGSNYFNPDEAAQKTSAANPGLPIAKANGLAWTEGTRLLKKAIAEHLDFAFETTLGGNTITALLEQAIAAGLEVRIWYVGLSSPEQHIAGVRERVAAGGHDIPEEKIRERYDKSRLNLIRLLKTAAEVIVYDNSAAGDPKAGKPPAPRLLLHMEAGEVRHMCPLPEVPEWAKPILAEALKGAG